MKRLFALLAAGILLLLLGACGRGVVPAAETTAAETIATEPTTAETTAAPTTAAATEAPTEPTTESPEAAQLRLRPLYENAIDGYAQMRQETWRDIGYDFDWDGVYYYAFKDINNDGVTELVIAEDLGDEMQVQALYTLDDDQPVLAENLITRQGHYWITADGYLIFTYKFMDISQLVGTELKQNVVEVDKDRWAFDSDEEWEAYQRAFLKEHGISAEEMQFDFVRHTGKYE